MCVAAAPRARVTNAPAPPRRPPRARDAVTADRVYRRAFDNLGVSCNTMPPPPTTTTTTTTMTTRATMMPMTTPGITTTTAAATAAAARATCVVVAFVVVVVVGLRAELKADARSGVHDEGRPATQSIAWLYIWLLQKKGADRQAGTHHQQDDNAHTCCTTRAEHARSNSHNNHW